MAKKSKPSGPIVHCPKCKATFYWKEKCPSCSRPMEPLPAEDQTAAKIHCEALLDQDEAGLADWIQDICEAGGAKNFSDLTNVLRSRDPRRFLKFVNTCHPELRDEVLKLTMRAAVIQITRIAISVHNRMEDES